MFNPLFSLSLLSILSLRSYAARIYPLRSSRPQCQTFHTTFPPSSVSNLHDNPYSPTPFVALSPQASYQTAQGGLELFLQKPVGDIESKNGINNQVADGATINSTFTLLYGKVTFEVISPTTSGVVTAVILIADEHDEIDIEFLGSEPGHWQTNIFAPSPKDERPLFGVFSSIEDVPRPDHTIAQVHAYTIDWSRDRIEWGVDGKVVRTLTRDQTLQSGELHYPSHPARIQLGIWDASSPGGTSAWAKGPINWKDAPHKMVAVVKSVTVECPVY